MAGRDLLVRVRIVLVVAGVGLLLAGCTMSRTTADHVEGQLRQHGI